MTPDLQCHDEADGDEVVIQDHEGQDGRKEAQTLSTVADWERQRRKSQHWIKWDDFRSGFDSKQKMIANVFFSDLVNIQHTMYSQHG